MNRRWFPAAMALVILVATQTLAEDKKPARVLMVTQSKGFKHGSVTRKEGQLSPAEKCGHRAGHHQQPVPRGLHAGLREGFHQGEPARTTTSCSSTPPATCRSTRKTRSTSSTNGSSKKGTASSARTRPPTPTTTTSRYWDMIGGTFNGHPWGSGETVTITVHDKKHPASKPWGDEFTIKDEIYQFKNWQPEKVRVLMSLNMAKCRAEGAVPRADPVGEELRRRQGDAHEPGPQRRASGTNETYHGVARWAASSGSSTRKKATPRPTPNSRPSRRRRPRRIRRRSRDVENGMKVRHATLLNVFGRPAKHGGVTIVPADVSLAGKSFRTSFPLAELTADRIPPVLKRPIQEGFDAAWVRARLPHVFGFTPEPSEAEKTLLGSGFVAVVDGETEGVPFECSDYYGKTSLMFSDDETDEAAKERAATAFWGVLLSEPDELEDFETSVPHFGASVMLHFGCEDGEPYCRETPE